MAFSKGRDRKNVRNDASIRLSPRTKNRMAKTKTNAKTRVLTLKISKRDKKKRRKTMKCWLPLVI